MPQETRQRLSNTTSNVTLETDLMGPPHHEVGEKRNPQNRAQEGEGKEFSGFLLPKVSDVK